MVQDDPVRVFVDVPQGAASDLMKVGVAARIIAADTPGTGIIGTIARTSAAIDPRARTFRAEIDIPNPDHRLVPGQYVQVAFTLQNRGSNQVPAAALVFRSSAPEVAELAHDGSVHFQPVTIARDDGDMVELSSGVAKGDRLVLNISSAIADGDKVRVSGADALSGATLAMRAR
jgi:multidrug efflux pump subunit AcrA (membrane-fusion protein)